jgi:hypothetical protein
VPYDRGGPCLYQQEIVMRETIYGKLIPCVDYSTMSVDEAIRRACNSKEYVECAAMRIGRAFSKNEITHEIIGILTDQVLDKLIRRGVIQFSGYGEDVKFRKAQEGLCLQK